MTTHHPKKGHHVSLNYPLSIVIIDHPGSGAPDAATLAKYAAAMTKGMAGDFAPEYERTATWRYDTTPAPGELVCGLFEHPDQVGALGYHGLFFIKVFPKLDAQDGAELSQTLDHEGKEAVEDLTTDLAVQGSDGHFWADEPCDAVENDSGYTIDGVTLSNFVTKAWYSARDSKYDFLGRLTKPQSVTEGGYCQYFDPAKGWQQITHAAKAPRSYRLQSFGRSHRRRMKTMSMAGVDAKFDA